MKQLLFGIFAHPDDEAFGPSGTLLHRTKSGTDVHLICATDGAGGVNCDNVDDLGSVRKQERRAAGETFGAKSMVQLRFEDGGLNNAHFHTLATAIEERVMSVCNDYDEPVEVRFMTFERSGITGHLDHIAVSMASSYVFYRLKNSRDTLQLQDISYFCLCDDIQTKPDTSFVIMPKGVPRSEVDHTEDVKDVLDEKLAIMRLHHSQRGDAEKIINLMGDDLGEECFVVES